MITFVWPGEQGKPMPVEPLHGLRQTQLGRHHGGGYGEGAGRRLPATARTHLPRHREEVQGALSPQLGRRGQLPSIPCSGEKQGRLHCGRQRRNYIQIPSRNPQLLVVVTLTRFVHQIHVDFSTESKPDIMEPRANESSHQWAHMDTLISL